MCNQFGNTARGRDQSLNPATQCARTEDWKQLAVPKSSSRAHPAAPPSSTLLPRSSPRGETQETQAWYLFVRCPISLCVQKVELGSGRTSWSNPLQTKAVPLLRLEKSGAHSRDACTHSMEWPSLEVRAGSCEFKRHSSTGEGKSLFLSRRVG